MRETWKKILLKDACKVFADGDWIESKDQSSDGIRLVQTGNIGFGYFKDKEDKSRFISEETFLRLKCTEILPGDLLVSRLPDPVGKSCIIPEINSKMITGVDCTIIRPKDNLSSEFLCYYQMSNQYLKDVQSGVSGATRQRISRKNLGIIEIPLPPFPEQQRIVAILDEAFAAIDKAKANAEQNLKNAKELFESYLQGVFENKGEGWEMKTIQEITKVVNGYAFSSKDFKSTNTIKSVKITNVGVKEFVEETENFLPEKFKETLKEYQVREGNIVIALTRTIISAGLKVAVVPESYDRALINQRVAALVPNEKIVNQRYLYNFLITDGVAKYVLAHVNTLMQPNLSINDLRNLSVPCPSLKEQQAIVQKLDALSLETKRLEAIYQQKINDLEELKKSVLQKAFSGELKGKLVTV